MARRIVCTNEDGVQCVFTDEFAPWLLENCEGVYEAKNNVTISDNTMTDGATYQGSIMAMRNIVLTLRDHYDGDHQANRALLYNLFKARALGTFEYMDGTIHRTIQYRVESISIDSVKHSRRATVSLLCPDPYFTDIDDITVQMAGWVKAFEFPFEPPAQGFEFGYRTAEKLKAIENEEAADFIGVTITVDVAGPATSPKIYHVEQGNSISVGTEANPLELIAGDQVVITTHTNNKHVYLIRAGEKTEINEYLSEDSEFLQLMHGTNTFGYSAASGEAYLTVSISFRYQYLGV